MAPSHLAREVGIVVRVRGIERRPHAFEPRPESEAHQPLEKQGKGRDEETRTRALEQVTGGAKRTKNIKNKPVSMLQAVTRTLVYIPGFNQVPMFIPWGYV